VCPECLATPLQVIEHKLGSKDKVILDIAPEAAQEL
jgi:hypothetical protein